MTTNVAAADRTPALKRSSRSQAEGLLRQGRRRPIVQFIPGPRLIRLACGLPVAAVAYGSAVYGFLAIVLAVLCAGRLGLNGFVAAVAVWLGTPLLFYMYLAPPFSHACSAFAVAATG